MTTFKLNEAQQRLPIGGHQYPEQGLLVRGDTFQECVRNLADYRVNNHIPVGDPEQDVLKHYAKNWPWMVKVDWEATPKEQNKEYILYRLWVDDTSVRPPTKLITTKEAKDRWKVCEKCPFNVSISIPATSEAKELKKRVFLLRRGAEVPKNIHLCALHRYADLSVLSFIENPTSFVDRKMKDTNKPSECWVK